MDNQLNEPNTLMEVRPIIFLDIDGVLNCEQFYNEYYKTVKKRLRKQVKAKEIDDKEYYRSQLCPNRIKLLNQLCEECNADVVISSTWRLGKTVEQLQGILNDNGATFTIIGKTGSCECRIRGCEIYKWLDENITEKKYGCHSHNFYRYAIIDDDSDMLLWQQAHFFQTDQITGLNHVIAYRVKQFLTHQTF